MKSRFLSIILPLLFSSFLSLAKGGGHPCASHSVHTAIYVHHSQNRLNGMPADSMRCTVVYNDDTLRGTARYKNGKFLMANSDTTLKLNPDNLALKSMTLYRADTSLTLVRLERKDRQMYRLIHSGKLNIYDDRGDFVHDAKHIGTVKITPDGSPRIVGRRGLINFINKIYGAQLSRKETSWEQLIAYIDNMD